MAGATGLSRALLMSSRNTTSLLPGLNRIISCLLTVLLLSAPVMAEEAPLSESRVKTDFLYNFSRFVTWPPAALQDRPEFTLCVFGTDPFGAELDNLTGKAVQDKTLVVRRHNSLALVDDCQLVYISENAELTAILFLLREQPVLTVGDAPDFIEQGGIIQFIAIEDKVRFRINAGAAKSAGLNISSKLLSLAASVTGSN